MPNEQSTELARRLKPVLKVDDGRATDSPFKLTAGLRKDVVDDLASLERLDALTGDSEGDRAEASLLSRKAFEELERQLRGGFNFIAAIDEGAISEEERAGVYEKYLWKGGLLGRFDDWRCLALARQAVEVDAEGLVKAEWRYPAARLARINAQLAIIDGVEADATGATRQGATKSRNAAQDLGETTLLRVRFYYCSATRDADQTPELARIEFQPRRDYGTVAEAKKAAPTGGDGAAGGAAPKPAGS